MIKIDQLCMAVDEPKESIKQKIADLLKVDITSISQIRILRRSIDARKKTDVHYEYSVLCRVSCNEEKLLRRLRGNRKVSLYKKPAPFLTVRAFSPQKRPVIVGAGPAGLFCGYLLALHGFAPLLIERGRDVDRRKEDVRRFWEEGTLDPSSNVQFGEGGAGAFSDGKLNTLVNDRARSDFVLHTLVRFGAPEQILWDAKPHVGTDLLLRVVRNLRREIVRQGGEVHFEETFNGFTAENGQLTAAMTDRGAYETNDLVTAIGHSARDTFAMLHNENVFMTAKAFAVGFRIEHPQAFIDERQYGAYARFLPAAPYKLKTQLPDGRGVYSFCMCPGGYVINASSLPGRTAVNGMSYSDRGSGNANSAIVVTVGPGDYDADDPLGAVAYQEALEQKAYRLGGGAVPQQLYGDLCSGRVSSSYGDFASQVKGNAVFADLRECLPKDLLRSFCHGMDAFAGKIKGFDRYDAILSGIESRTSSPVRIVRDETLQSNILGLYPCGEGAGYAGGIMSAAMDGLKVAEKIMEKYQVKDESERSGF